MNTIRRTIQVPGRSDPVRLYALGDLHLGNALCREDLIRQVVAEIAADPDAYWIGMGDYADFINRKDPRHRESRMAKWLWGKDDVAAVQRSHVVNMLAPIAPKCLALLKGNHEDAILHHYETDVYYGIVEGLRAAGAPEPLALGVDGFLLLTLHRASKDRRAFILYLHHGYVGGRLAGAKALELERLPGNYEFDIAILSHSHGQMMAIRKTRLVPTKSGRVMSVPKVMIQNGTFLPTHGDPEGYGELKGYPPAQVGAARVDVWGFRGNKNEIEIRAVV